MVFFTSAFSMRSKQATRVLGKRMPSIRCAFRMGSVLTVAIFLILQCRTEQTYDVHIGRSFYSLDLPSYARMLGSDQLRGRARETCRIEGAYAEPDADVIADPMIRSFDAGGGLTYARLSSEIDAEDGDIVAIKGRIVQRETVYTRTRTVLHTEFLQPETVRVLIPSAEVKETVQREYSKMREGLQQRITPKGSRLILPDNPRWYVVRSKHDDSCIVSARVNDLMYQAEIDYVLDGRTKRIRKLYAVEWFKGE